jgi:hypothetical protein
MTIADFVGTWYFRGDRKAPCQIRLHGAKLEVTDEQHNTYPAHVEGVDTLVTEPPPRLRSAGNAEFRREAYRVGERRKLGAVEPEIAFRYFAAEAGGGLVQFFL